MSSETKEDRRLARRRGAGVRELKSALFGFTIGSIPLSFSHATVLPTPAPSQDDLTLSADEVKAVARKTGRRGAKKEVGKAAVKTRRKVGIKSEMEGVEDVQESRAIKRARSTRKSRVNGEINAVNTNADGEALVVEEQPVKKQRTQRKSRNTQEIAVAIPEDAHDNREDTESKLAPKKRGRPRKTLPASLSPEAPRSTKTARRATQPGSIPTEEDASILETAPKATKRSKKRQTSTHDSNPDPTNPTQAQNEINSKSTRPSRRSIKPPKNTDFSPDPSPVEPAADPPKSRRKTASRRTLLAETSEAANGSLDITTSPPATNPKSKPKNTKANPATSTTKSHPSRRPTSNPNTTSPSPPSHPHAASNPTHHAPPSTKAASKTKPRALTPARRLHTADADSSSELQPGAYMDRYPDPKIPLSLVASGNLGRARWRM